MRCKRRSEFTFTKLIIMMSILVIVSTMAVGCNDSQPSADQNYTQSNTYSVITVYSEFQDEYFYSCYGNLILQKYPNIRFKLIHSTSNSSEETVKNIEQYKPDLIITYNNYYQELRKQGILSDLKPLITADNIKLENYYPEMISALNNDSGQLNGLSPLVNVFGIFYNKNLFDTNRIDYPTNKMTWEEILQISNRFSGTGSIGMEGISPTGLLLSIARTKGWQIVDQKRHKVVFNKEEWINELNNVLVGSQNSNILNGTGDDLFLQGKSAMFYGMLNIIPMLQKQQHFSWGIVTTPVDSRMRDINSEIFFNDIFCIPENAANKETAWQIIKFIMSDDAVSYLQNNSITGAVSTLNMYMNKITGVDLSPLWQQKIDTRPYLNTNISTAFSDAFDSMIDSVLTTGIRKNMSAEECFNIIVEKSSELYQKELLNHK